jgi:ketosteroid isomerase-like protein
MADTRSRPRRAAPTSQESAVPRTPQEIFQHHAVALGAADVEEVLADYPDDAVLITPRGTLRGKAGIREAFESIFADLPDATWNVPTQIFEGDVLFIEWTAESPAARVRDGIDTFVFGEDGIRAQTVRYTREPTGQA